MHLSELVQMTREVASLFEEQVGPWSVPVLLTALMAEVEQLVDHLMIQQGYRRSRGEALDLADDLADILFLPLLRGADHAQIDLESASRTMLHRRASSFSISRHVILTSSSDLDQHPPGALRWKHTDVHKDKWATSCPVEHLTVR